MNDFTFEPDDASTEEQTRRSPWSRRVIRMGVGMGVVGLVATSMGAQRLAQIGNAFSAPTWQFCHKFGLLLMLAGTLFVLIGLRWQLVGRQFEWMRQFIAPKENAMPPRLGPNSAFYFSWKPLFRLVLWTCLTCIVIGIVAWESEGVVLRIIAILVPPLALIAIVMTICHGSSWQRTFAIGAAVAWSVLSIGILSLPAPLAPYSVLHNLPLFPVRPGSPPMTLWSSRVPGRDLNYQLLFYLVGCPVSGLLAVAFRGFLIWTCRPPGAPEAGVSPAASQPAQPSVTETSSKATDA